MDIKDISLKGISLIVKGHHFMLVAYDLVRVVRIHHP